MRYSLPSFLSPFFYLGLSKEGTWESWLGPATSHTSQSVYLECCGEHLHSPECLSVWSPAAHFWISRPALPSWSSLASPRAAAPAGTPAGCPAGRAAHLLGPSTSCPALPSGSSAGAQAFCPGPQKRRSGCCCCCCRGGSCLQRGNSSQAGEGEAPENPLQLRTGKPPPAWHSPPSLQPLHHTADEGDSLPKVSHWWERFLSSFLRERKHFPPFSLRHWLRST